MNTASREINDDKKSTLLNFSFIYLAHARAVNYISWRKTSKYMPKGSVSNILITASADKICRIWVQTVLPDDGLLNISHLNSSSMSNSKFRTHRQRHRFLQRIKHIKACFQLRKSTRAFENPSIIVGQNSKQDFLYYSSPPSVLPSSHSAHDLHSYGFQNVGFFPSLHFHLTGTINSETDIPLVPSMKYTDDTNSSPNFVLHWMNNKEMFFNMQAESLIYELVCSKENIKKDAVNQASSPTNTLDKETVSDSNGELVRNDEKPEMASINSLDNMANINDSEDSDRKKVNEVDTSMSVSDALDAKIEALIRDWHSGPDLMFAVHPIDGSFLIWIVHWLDEHHTGSLRQAQISFSTRIPNAFSIGDAFSVSSNISILSTTMFNTADIDIENKLSTCMSSTNIESLKSSKFNTSIPPIPMVYMVTHHSNGTLNLWHLIFAEESKFSQLLSVEHVTRISGHRYKVNEISCHPFLPLVLTTSAHDIESDLRVANKSVEKRTTFSELILWKIDPVNPLSQSGGLKELTRIDSFNGSNFNIISWIPTAIQKNTSSTLEDTPSAYFVACHEDRLCIYQAVIDASYLLAKIAASEQLTKRNLDMSVSSLSSTEELLSSPLKENVKILSQQSTAKPGAILQLNFIDDESFESNNILLLHTYNENLIDSHYKNKKAQSDGQNYYLALFYNSQSTNVHMWKLKTSSTSNIEHLELGKSQV